MQWHFPLVYRSHSMWSRIPRELPIDLRRDLLDFLGVHPCTRLARVAQGLYHSSLRLCEFRRRTRWRKHLDWATSTRSRRIDLMFIVRSSDLHEDPRGEARGACYDMTLGEWSESGVTLFIFRGSHWLRLKY